MGAAIKPNRHVKEEEKVTVLLSQYKFVVTYERRYCATITTNTDAQPRQAPKRGNRNKCGKKEDAPRIKKED